ncbi:MAG TPA: methyltransferase domain-containing protein [Terriglobales bacterium]|nr:methyltransferase domain-containing protein [Terriglobales bacterium]
MPEALKLHLGCGTVRQPGFVNCDLHKTAATDMVFDVQERWPFADNSASLIASAHMLEHLDDPLAFFREAWRVLRPTGMLSLQLPYGASDEGATDLTHKRLWFPGTFCAFQPGYGEIIGNPQHEWPAPFSVDYVGARIHRDLVWLARWPWRAIGLRVLRFLWSGYVELFVQMTALKTPEQLAMFREHGHPGNTVPFTVVAWMADWDRRYRGPAQLKEFAGGRCENTPGEVGHR